MFGNTEKIEKLERELLKQENIIKSLQRHSKSTYKSDIKQGDICRVMGTEEIVEVNCQDLPPGSDQSIRRYATARPRTCLA